MHTKKQKRNLVKVNGRLVRGKLCFNKRLYTFLGSGSLIKTHIEIFISTLSSRWIGDHPKEEWAKFA
jgi:hypothetical protein